MKKKIWTILIGIMLTVIGTAPLFYKKTFEIGLELVWFGLGILWLLSGLKIYKKTKFRPHDPLLYTALNFYLFMVTYIIVLKPYRWNQTFKLFGHQVTEILLLSIALIFSFACAVNHLIYWVILKYSPKKDTRNKKN